MASRTFSTPPSSSLVVCHVRENKKTVQRDSYVCASACVCGGMCVYACDSVREYRSVCLCTCGGICVRVCLYIYN
uniref:Uncharacterized protein n=1 Tax=Octopus bimaculoides TaxID=37653 RepID=A0A0L8GVJ5_OCTBM